jgi:hypothetical protein
MNCSRFALVVVVLLAAACGGAVNGDGSGGGAGSGVAGGTGGMGGIDATGGATAAGSGGDAPGADSGGSAKGGSAGCVVRTETYADETPFVYAPVNDLAGYSQCVPTCGYGKGDWAYVLQALPAGECAGESVCAMPAQRHCGCGTFGGGNSYVCACVAGRWSCTIAGLAARTCLAESQCDAGIAGQDGGKTSGDAGRDAAACGVIRASDYDQSCNTVQDCTSVFEGDTCKSQCACQNATINKAALDQYHPIFAGTGYVCPCPMLGMPSCIGGICTMCPPAGCPAKDGGTAAFDAGSDPLVGTWTSSRPALSVVDATVTFASDKTFTFVETVAPFSYPAGYVPNGCVTTDTYFGTYAESVSGGASTLTWAFAGGTANAVSGCNNASNDSTGTPMTADAIASYRDQGLIPPTTTTYAVTSTTLVLTSPANAYGVGRSPGTTFTKSH